MAAFAQKCSHNHQYLFWVIVTLPTWRDQVLMKDPVIAADGHTYERAAMQSWLAIHQTSPVTGAALSHAKLVPNVIIRGVIQQQLC